MGYDVTFHAISPVELENYVFDVIRHPDHALDRSKQITSDPVKQEFILQHVYTEHLNQWTAKVQSDDDFKLKEISSSYAVVAAMIAGYLHPFHYARNFSLSLISDDYPKVKNFFQSLTQFKDSPLSGFTDTFSGQLPSNYACSGVVQDPQAALVFVDRHQKALIRHYGKDDVEALRIMLQYCIDRDLYFIEASEIVIPMNDVCNSDDDNLHAYFMKDETEVAQVAPMSTQALGQVTSEKPPSRAGLFVVISTVMILAMLTSVFKPDVKDMIKLALTAYLCLQLYQGKSWARWTLLVLLTLGSLLGIIALATQGPVDKAQQIAMITLVCIFGVLICILAFSKGVIQHIAMKNRSSDRTD